jgi:hypothetical protein
MFTYKFLGLDHQDAETPYYYGSLPAKPEVGHTLKYDETNNRYAVIRIEGDGLQGSADSAQRELAWADIGRSESVPTLWLQKLLPELNASGRSFDYDEVKQYSQNNRETRFSLAA